MRIAALLLSLFVAAVGALGLALPATLPVVVRKLASPAGVYAVTALRLVTGAALFVSASASRIPRAVSALGNITFLAGAVTPLLGPERFRRVLAWWTARGNAFIRAWSLVALAVGLLLAWALTPASRERKPEAPEREAGEAKG